MGRYDRLQVIWANAGYGSSLVGLPQATAGWSLESVRRPAQQPTFQMLSRRWVVERTLGWLNLTDVAPPENERYRPARTKSSGLVIQPDG